MDFKQRLKEIESNVKQQMANYVPGGFAAIPDGTYNLKVKAAMNQTKKEPVRLQVDWCFIVADGDCEGRQIWDRTIIQDNEVGLNICRSRIDDLFPNDGWPEDDLSRLADMVDTITANLPVVVARCTTKESNGYTNTSVRIKEVLEPIESVGAVQEVDQLGPADEAPSVSEDDTASRLLNFCASQGIDGLTEGLTAEEIVKALAENNLQFKEEELSAEEKELLESVDGGSELIIKKPKAKAVPVALAKKPIGKKR